MLSQGEHHIICANQFIYRHRPPLPMHYRLPERMFSLHSNATKQFYLNFHLQTAQHVVNIVVSYVRNYSLRFIIYETKVVPRECFFITRNQHVQTCVYTQIIYNSKIKFARGNIENNFITTKKLSQNHSVQIWPSQWKYLLVCSTNRRRNIC